MLHRRRLNKLRIIDYGLADFTEYYPAGHVKVGGCARPCCSHRAPSLARAHVCRGCTCTASHAGRTQYWAVLVHAAAHPGACARSPTHAVPKSGPLHLTLGKLHMALPLPISAEQLKLIPQVPPAILVGRTGCSLLDMRDGKSQGGCCG